MQKPSTLLWKSTEKQKAATWIEVMEHNQSNQNPEQKG